MLHDRAVDTVAPTWPRHRHDSPAPVRNALLRPGPDATYADGDDATWMDVDWPSLQRTLELLGRRVNVLDTGRRAGRPLLFIHGWSSNWQIFLLNIARVHGHAPRASRSTCRASAPRRCRRSRSRSGATRGPSTRSATRSASSASSVVGNSMGGFIGAELALAVPDAGRAARARVGRRARRPSTLRARARRVAAARLRGGRAAARARASSAAVVRRPRLRRAAMQWRRPLPGEAVGAAGRRSSCSSAGKPGFVPALDALLMDYAFRDRLAEIEIPVLIVWGAQRPARARSATPTRYAAPDRRRTRASSSSRTRATCR